MNRSTELYNEWRVYHENNPHVYDWICRLAAQAISAGHAHFGIATLWEKLRWEVTVGANDPDFVLPNNHRAYYARLWNKEHPRDPPFFRTAKLRSQGGPVDRSVYGPFTKAVAVDRAERFNKGAAHGSRVTFESGAPDEYRPIVNAPDFIDQEGWLEHWAIARPMNDVMW